MSKSIQEAQYGYWLKEACAEEEKSPLRDAILMGILTDAFNDPSISFPEYVRIVLENADKFHDLNEVKTSHGEFLRAVVKGAQVTMKKKGLFKK